MRDINTLLVSFFLLQPEVCNQRLSAGSLTSLIISLKADFVGLCKSLSPTDLLSPYVFGGSERSATQVDLKKGGVMLLPTEPRDTLALR